MSGTKNENRGGKRLTKLVLFESLRSVLKSGVTGKSSKSQNVLVAAKLGEPLSLPCVFGNQLPWEEVKSLTDPIRWRVTRSPLKARRQ